MSIQRLFITGTVLLALGTPSFAAPSSGDKSFLTAAAQGNMAEVALGKLASQKASRADVKSAGKEMVADHTKIFDSIKSVAKKEGVTVPTAMNRSQQSDYDKLSKLSGADFDKAYIKAMVDGHKSDIAAFQKEEKGTKDAAIKSAVDQALPTMQGHLSMFSGMKS